MSADARSGDSQAAGPGNQIAAGRIQRAVSVTMDMTAMSPYWTARDEDSVRRAMQHLCGMLGNEFPA